MKKSILRYMELKKQFVSDLQAIDIENIFVYVGDAVRWDHTPNNITDRGTALKTIAASTHSPTSFASLVTGKNPPNHGVSVFEQRIPREIFSLFDLPRYHTQFTNSIFEYAEREHKGSVDPIYSVLDIDPPNIQNPLDDLEEPFVVMERGPGGHAPYGNFIGTASDYFHQNGTASTGELQDDYQQSIQLDTDLFINRVNQLKARGLTEKTLIIYTSDHGELLGEGGELGHNSPMRPELVHVPTVFIHPDLPTGRIDSVVLHHTDLLPTLLDVLDIDLDPIQRFDGVSAAKSVSNDPRPSFYENRILPDKIPVLSGSLRYEGVWDSTGGYVFVRTPLHERLLIMAGKAIASAQRSYIRNHFPAALSAYMKGGTIVYGTPSFQQTKAEQTLRQASKNTIESEQVTLSNAAEERLRDLGYT